MSSAERAMKERLMTDASDLDGMLDYIDVEKVMIIRDLQKHNERFEHTINHYLKKEGLENVLRTAQQTPSDAECEEVMTVRIMPMPTHFGISINKIATPAQMEQITQMFMIYLEQAQMLLSRMEQNRASEKTTHSELLEMVLTYSPADQPTTEESALIYLSYPGRQTLMMIKIDTKNGIYDLPRETLLPNEIELSRRTIDLMAQEAESEEANFYLAVNPSRALPRGLFLEKATSTVYQYQREGRASGTLNSLGDVFGQPYSETESEGEAAGDMELSRGLVIVQGRKKIILPTDPDEDVGYLRDPKGNVTNMIDYTTERWRKMPN